jgi:hypothetical protein
MAKGTLTSREALRNFSEISVKVSQSHAQQVLRKIQRKMIEELSKQEEEKSIQD